MGVALLAAFAVGLMLVSLQVRLASVCVFAVIFIPLVFRLPVAILFFFAVIPFLGIMRRAVLFYLGPVKVDALLLLPDLMILLIFLRVMMLYRENILGFLKTNRVLQIFTIFAGYLLLQCFNPSQGSLIIGLNGLKYFILPMLWVYVGLCQTDQNLKQAFKIIAGVGVIAAGYGYWQYYFGLTAIDQYWVSNTSFASLGLFGKIRTFSIFQSAEEYSRFLQVAFMAGWGLLWPTWRSGSLFFQGIIFFALYQSGVRSSLLGAVFSWLSIGVWQKPSLSQRWKNMGLICVMLALVYSLAPFVAPLQSLLTSKTQSVETHVAGVLQPLQQSTFQIRIKIWREAVLGAFFKQPLGVGTGAMTRASLKFSQAGDSAQMMGFESYFFSVLRTTGLVGGLLLLLFWGSLLASMFKKTDFLDATWLTSLGILTGLILNSVFGNTPSIYAVAPIYYYLIGHVIRRVS